MKIVVSVVLAFLLVGCSEEAPKETLNKVQNVQSTEKVIEAVKEIKVEAASESAKEVQTEAIKEVQAEPVKEVQAEAVAKPVKPAPIKEVKKETKVEPAKEVQKEVKVESTPVVETAAPVAQKTGQSIYMACAGCHGTSAEKQALGKSKILKGWSAAQVSEALNGYKSGTYGAAMRGVMVGQASKLSEEEITLVSEYISTF